MIFSKILFYMNEAGRIIDGLDQPPLSVEIDPSNLCQLDCEFCINRAYRKQNAVNLGLNAYIRLVSDLKRLGVESITFTGGGEPLMHPQFKEMVYIAKSFGFEIGLITNGVFLDRVLDIINEFEFIRVSLDAGTSAVYRVVKGGWFFDEVINNMKAAKNAINGNTVLGASYVIYGINKEDIENAKDATAEIVDYLQFKPEIHGITDYCVSTFEDEPTLFTERFEPDSLIPCHIAGLVGIIGADGNVYYCCQKRGERNYSLGSIYESSFCDIWETRKNIKPNISECIPCRYMGYAKEYIEYSKPKYFWLRHKRFL